MALLLDLGCDVNGEDFDGGFPLSLAIRKHLSDIALLLMAVPSCDVNALDPVAKQVCVCVLAYECVCMYVHMHGSLDVSVCVRVCLHILCNCIYTCVCVQVCTCMQLANFVCVCVCVCVCVTVREREREKYLCVCVCAYAHACMCSVCIHMCVFILPNNVSYKLHTLHTQYTYIHVPDYSTVVNDILSCSGIPVLSPL